MGANLKTIEQDHSGWSLHSGNRDSGGTDAILCRTFDSSCLFEKRHWKATVSNLLILMVGILPRSNGLQMTDDAYTSVLHKGWDQDRGNFTH